MTHSGAVENKLVERYLLSELQDSEREEFELHFFSCAECTNDLNDGALLIDGARPFLDPAAAKRPEVPNRTAVARTVWWPALLPRFAFPALAVLSTILAVRLAHENWAVQQELAYYQQPRQIPGFTLLPATRGPVQIFQVPKAAREIQLAIDIDSDRPFAVFRCEIRSSQSDPKPVSILLTPPRPGQPVQLSVPVPSRDTELQIRLLGVATDSSEIEISSQTVRLHIQESH